MKEIKFRYWNGAKIENVGQLSFFTSGGIHVNEEYIDGSKLMQYTGMKDVNEKEIYEGDIVRDVSNSDLIFEIKWHDDNVGYYMPRDYDEEYAWTIAEPDLEVIGNVYSNPDLLPALSERG